MAKQDISIRKLVDKVMDGELTLPEMQRRYVWTATKVRDLLDSLYRGYPSGTILVWETDDPGNHRKLAVKGSKSSRLSSSLLLLDGQQRVTSLSAIISGEPVLVRNKTKPVDILFNLEHPDTLLDELTALEEEDEEDDDLNDEEGTDIQEEMRKRTFVVASKALEKDPVWVTVSDIFKMTDSQILKRIGINSDDDRWDKYTERLKAVRMIEKYEYSMVILDKKMSYEEVTEIFVRVNSLGAKLRGSDLALAQLTSRWKGFMNELEKFAKRFDHNEDYLHDTGLMVKTLVAIVSGQSKYKTIHRYSLEEYQKAWKNTQSALHYAYDFIRNNVGVENFRLISSPFLLIPIAYYAFMKKERISQGDADRLLLWFYVAHMKGRYSRGSSESYLDSDLNVLKQGKGPAGLLAQLKVHVKNFTVDEDELRFKNRRSPYFSMLFFISKQRKTVDWFTGIGISEKTSGKANVVQFHHIMPKSLLRDLGHESRAINDIANLTFIGGKTNRNISNKTPHQYLKDILEKRGNSIYSKNFLPRNQELWRIENFEAFLDARRKLLVKEINGFIEGLG
jgi:hypothetical protein